MFRGEEAPLGLYVGRKLVRRIEELYDDPEKRAMVESHIPMARAGESWEMAAAASFLLSDEALYITGQTLFVDGGLTLYADFRSTWSSE